MLAAYLAAFAAIAGVVWGAIHGMQRLAGWNDRRVAIAVAILGASSGLLVHAVGFIAVPTPGPVAWVCSAFFGLMAAFAGAGATDLNVAKAIIKKEVEQ